VTICACLGGGISMGSTIGFTTILVGKLQEEDDVNLKMSLEDASWLGTVWALSSTISSLFGGLLADSLGRKRAIMISSLPFIASWILLATSTSTFSVLSSMVLSGLGDGLMFPIIPVYVSEIAHPKLRATLINLVNSTQIIGLILDFSLILIFHWKTLAVMMIVPPVFTLVSMMMVPETPHWLASKGKIEEATKAMLWLRNGKDITEEIEEIKKISDGNIKSKSFCQNAADTYKVYTSRDFLKPFAFAGTFFCLYSFSGFSLVQTYMMTIFKESGSSIDGSTATLLVSFWRLAISFISSFALHHLSRRGLFFSTTLLLAASQALLGTFFYLKTLSGWDSWITSLGWFPLLAMFSIYAGGQLGFSPIIKILVSEVFPTSIRATSASLCIVVGFLCMSISTKLFSQFVVWFGFYGSFWLYSTFTLICLIFGYFGMPETSGVSLVKIQENLAKR